MANVYILPRGRATIPTQFFIVVKVGGFIRIGIGRGVIQCVGEDPDQRPVIPVTAVGGSGSPLKPAPKGIKLP